MLCFVLEIHRLLPRVSARSSTLTETLTSIIWNELHSLLNDRVVKICPENDYPLRNASVPEVGRDDNEEVAITLINPQVARELPILPPDRITVPVS